MTRILIVANQTAAGQHLIDAVLKRRAEGECEFTLLVPAEPVHASVVQGMLAASVNVPQNSDGEDADYAMAERRLRAALEAFRANGVRVTGEVGEPGPLRAIESYLKYREFDEIIVSTLDRAVSRWLHQDLPTKVHRKFNLPVTVVTADA